MSPARTDAVGKSTCPLKGCDKEAAVFKYRARSGDEKKRRFAGRLYCICPTHGRVENQEYLLEHIEWAKDQAAPTPAPTGRTTNGASSGATPQPAAKAPAAAVRAPVTAPASKPPAAPVTSRESPTKPSSSSSWLPEFFKS